MGSERHFNYTAIDDAVDVASHLQDLSSTYRVPVITGAATADAISGIYYLHAIESVSVRGRPEQAAIKPSSGMRPTGRTSDAHPRDRMVDQPAELFRERQRDLLLRPLEQAFAAKLHQDPVHVDDAEAERVAQHLL